MSLQNRPNGQQFKNINLQIDGVKSKSISQEANKFRKYQRNPSKLSTTEILDVISNNDERYISLLDTSILKKPEYRIKKKKSFGGMTALRTSLKRYGVAIPILVNKRLNGNYYIVNGSNVNMMWRTLKNKTIRAILIEVSIEQEQELHLFLNRISQETDLAAILNHLDHLNPEDFGLYGISPKDEEDDKEHLKKELEKAKLKALENEKKALVRWSFTFNKSTRKILGEKINVLKKELNMKYDSDVLEYLIINYKMN